ncbi:MAG: CRISPR system precrRNA processing endoribonuclease RAMP protein Cas6 [Thermofilaceae archaeon]|nr:CRISPR system precrRNA processing endoribonuclease RAMP protein Cas6 [Thermofilaceae archaeon]MCX8180002.1 CRISPR system precrRNA processing endoribonuclease RAMP protein Cas6 [Thermofilaceae archaeon]MDW8004692.1 CRISPR system precrRNA processing endoribonuclease RAMP protein Cas6 [Thermofilaceae archaeon]
MYALTVWLEIRPLQNCFVPSFTSKVTRTAFAALTGVEPKLGRRASFSLLFKDSRPLFKVCDKDSKPLTVNRDERLRARFSLLVENVPEIQLDSVVFKFSAVEFLARVQQVEVVDVSKLWLDLSRKFVVRFLTPTLLPVPGRGPLMKALGVRRRYRLLPDLPLALGLLVYDLKLQGVDLVSCTPGKVFKWGLKALAELDYRVKPVNVLYSVRGGVPVTERGFVGYVSYELLDLNSSMCDVLKRLMGYAVRFGLGKSRGIGFGHVEVNSLEAVSRM